MNSTKNALLVLLLAASTTAAQRANRLPGKSLASGRAIGLSGDGVTRKLVVFDANTDTVLGSVALGDGSPICYGDSVITKDLSRAYVATVGSEIFVIDLTTTPPSLASGVNPFPVSNFGLDIALTADERFLVVCAGNVPQPVAVVDVATRLEVDTFTAGNDTIAVDVGPDGSVLVASDNQNRVRRLTIDAAGQLTNSNQFLAESFPLNLYNAPGGAVGLVVVWNTGQVRSFTIPGMVLIETLSTAGADLGVCALPDTINNRIYVRKDSTLQAFPFDSATGDFGTTAAWNVTPGAVTVCYGIEQLALHPDGSKVYTSVPGGVQVRDSASGVLIKTITHPDLDTPSGLTVQGGLAEVPALADVKPGACPNSYNPGGHGVLPVAVIGTDDFDATAVDPTSLRLARADGVGGSVASNEGPPGPHSVVADVSTPFEGGACGCHKFLGDGIPDMEAKFRSDSLLPALQLGALAPGTNLELVLTGRLLDGTPFSARDCVRIVGPGVPPGTVSVATAGDGWVEITPRDKQLDGGGFGRFDRTYPLGSRVTLTAFEIEGLTFFAWEVDGVFQKVGQTTLQLHVKGNHAVHAVYGTRKR